MNKNINNSEDQKKHKDSHDNVIGINELTAQKKMSTFSTHLHETHRIFVQSISPRLNHFFEGLNDFFFDMAEQAENNVLQNQYFAAIGDTRKNKSTLTRQFAKNVNIIFQKFKNQDFVYFIENKQQTEETAKTLTLIKDDDLDQKLAINNVVAKISQIYLKELHLLNQRYAELAQMDHLIEQHNPIGPDAIVNAFALSLKVLKSENNIKLMIIKLFEKNMVESLGPAYRMVNKYLKKHGILPDLTFTVQQRTNTDQPINNSINYLAQKLSGEDENYKKIADILDHDREQIEQNSYSAENIVQFSQLSDALNQIKSELLTDQELASKDNISPLELKDELIRKLKSLKAMSASQQLNAADENTIDLIGELFQFLVDDRNLPETIQLVLSKLQLPYLQIALKDPTFFSDKQNNARQLLNIIAESAVGWSPETDDKSLFLNKVKEIVNFILKNHEKNINYEKLIVRFIQLDQKLKKRADILERRTSAQISGRERLNVAKNNTADFLRTNLKGQKVPALIRELLLKPWANVLILSELRQQDSPGILEKHQNFVVNLIQAANPDNTHKNSQAEIESLSEELTDGLKLVAIDSQDLQTKTKQLQKCLQKINGLKASRKPVEFIDPSEILKLSKEFNQESSVGSLIEHPDQTLHSPENIPIVDDEFNEKAMNIKLGEWIEINSKDQPQRVKLSWKSPISGKLLFVNAKGAKVVDLFPIELAEKLRKQDCITLQQVPLMDRAMSSIADKMKKRKAAQKK
jgi:hypothetical protein